MVIKKIVVVRCRPVTKRAEVVISFTQPEITQLVRAIDSMIDGVDRGLTKEEWSVADGAFDKLHEAADGLSAGVLSETTRMSFPAEEIIDRLIRDGYAQKIVSPVCERR